MDESGKAIPSCLLFCLLLELWFPCSRSIMKSEKRSNRLSLSSLFCFGGPRVNDSDPPPPVGGDREMLLWSACFVALGKKKVPAHSPARSSPVRPDEKSRPKKSSAAEVTAISHSFVRSRTNTNREAVSEVITISN